MAYQVHALLPWVFCEEKLVPLVGTVLLLRLKGKLSRIRTAVLCERGSGGSVLFGVARILWWKAEFRRPSDTGVDETRLPEVE